MNSVVIKDGKLLATKEPEVKNGKPRKYPYTPEQYDSLLKIARAAKIDIGTSKTQNSKAVNSVTRAIIENFITEQNKPKEK